jgi:hypothetical protein
VPHPFRKAQGHAPGAAVIGSDGFGDRRNVGGLLQRGADGEFRVAAPQPHVDRSRREFAGDLCRRAGQGIQQSEPQCGIEWGGEPVGQRGRLLAAGFGGYAGARSAVPDPQQIGDAGQFDPWSAARLSRGALMPVDQLPVLVGDELRLPGQQPLQQLVDVLVAEVRM